MTIRRLLSHRRRLRTMSTIARSAPPSNAGPSARATSGASAHSTDPSGTPAVFLPPTDAGLHDAGVRLRAGGLVSFPTETVYGLGANALNEDAVQSIFTTKGRPLTDPLIVHAPTTDECLSLLELSPAAKPIYTKLATAFWPGPLTLVGKAVPAIPLKVTAGTGFVGIRCPEHEIARRMLVEARVPVAAPSANRFGHVSPTTAMHVHCDLGDHPIAIINGEEEEGTTCGVGIESTVLKVDDVHEKIIIFRRGGVSEDDIRAVLSGTGYSLEVLNKTVPMHAENKNVDEELPLSEAVDAVGQQAPGQCLTHYAPDVNTSMVVIGRGEGQEEEAAIAGAVGSAPCPCPLSECVVIDFGGRLLWMKNHVIGYRDLSVDKDFREAARRLFDTLRWTESVENVKHVLLVDVNSESEGSGATGTEHLKAVADRLFRAASGKYSRVDLR